jgi:hypothetical protein
VPINKKEVWLFAEISSGKERAAQHNFQILA